MNVASIDLCKQLYELSGWGTGTTGVAHHDGSLVFGWIEGGIPAYDLGYLLRSLPAKTSITKFEDVYMALYASPELIEFRADTPEDACAKLAIELFKQGVLKK